MVVAGAWNPAVVTPEWILRYALERREGDDPIRVSATVPAGIGLVVDMPRYTIEDMTFSVRPDALVLQMVQSTEDAFDRLESVARNTLKHLTHTPVGGLGYNFEFVDDNPSPDSLSAFTAANIPLIDHLPAGWVVQTSALISSFARDGGVVNIQRVHNDGHLKIKFNFHYAVTSASACHELLSADPPRRLMWTDLQHAQALVNDLMGDNSNEN